MTALSFVSVSLAAFTPAFRKHPSTHTQMCDCHMCERFLGSFHQKQQQQQLFLHGFCPTTTATATTTTTNNDKHRNKCVL